MKEHLFHTNVRDPLLQSLPASNRIIYKKRGSVYNKPYKRRFFILLSILLIIGGFILFLLKTFNENINLFITPTELIAKIKDMNDEEIVIKKWSIGGVVKPHSIKYSKDHKKYVFFIMDDNSELLVFYDGTIPSLFKEGQATIAKGHLEPKKDVIKDVEDEENSKSNESNHDENADGIDCYKQVTDDLNNKENKEDTVIKHAQPDFVLMATEILAKHDENYQPLKKEKES